MDLAQLRTFRMVARAGSVTGAARMLGQRPSTVSEAIRSLESSLDTTLFQRGRAGMSLTEAGAILRDRADGILAAVEQAVLDVQDLESGEQGRFVIGCHDTLGQYFLPRFMVGFLPSHPRIELALWNRSSAEVRDAVLDRTVHFGLVVNTAPHPDLVIVDAFTDRIAVVAPTAAADANEARQRLRDTVLVYPARQPFEGLVQRLIAAGCPPVRTLPVGDLGLARALALGGVGLTVLPQRVAFDQPGLVELHPSLPSFDDTIHLVYRSDLHRTRAAMALRDALVAHGRSLDPVAST